MGNDSTLHQDPNAPEGAPADSPPPLPRVSLPPPLPSQESGELLEPGADAESTRNAVNVTVHPPVPEEADADAAMESRWSDLTTLYAEYDAAAGSAAHDPGAGRAELVDPGAIASAAASPAPVALPDDVRDIDDLVRFRDGRDEPARRQPRAPGRRLSWLGLAAMLAGIAACVLTEWPVGRASPTLVGSIAGAAAALALLVSIVRGRTGSGVPVVALLLCLAAVAVDRYHVSPKSPGTTGGWVKQQIDRVGPALTGNSPAVVTPSPASPPAVAPPVSVGPSTPPQDPKAATPSGSKLFPLPGADSTDGGFDVTYGSADPPVPAKPAAPVNPKPAAPLPGPKTPVSPVLSPEYKVALAARQRAEEKVRNAEALFLEHFDRSPAYKAARAEVDAATELVERLKKQYDPYASALVEAARRRIEAQEKLSRLRETSMAGDPKVAAARSELDAAEDRVRATPPAVTTPAPGKTVR